MARYPRLIPNLSLDDWRKYWKAVFMAIRFEWDDAKASLNYANHGVDVERAKRAFADVMHVGEYDDRFDYGENRYSIVGMVDGTLLYVAYTERDDRIRIIMARRATRHEQDDDFEQNGRIG